MPTPARSSDPRVRKRIVAFIQQHRRWQIVFLLFLCSVVNNLDRQTLSVLAPTLERVLNFGPREYSYVVTAFLTAYALGYLFCGSIVDQFGVRKTLACAMAFWSIAGMLHAFAAGWVTLALFRFLLGLGESFVSPSGIKALAEWAPDEERGLSAAIFSNGNTVGAIIAPPLVSILALRFSWRDGFLIPGIAGLVLLLFWTREYASPASDGRLTESERKLLPGQHQGDQRETKVSMRKLLLNPLCIAFFFMRFLTDSVTYFFSFWIPNYLSHSRGLSLAMLGLVSWIPFLASDIGGLGGGALSDLLVRRGSKASKARRTVMLIAALIMPLTGTVVVAPTITLCITLLALAFAVQSCWMANQLAMIAESSQREVVGRVLSFSALGGSLGGILSTLVAGRAIAAYGYGPIFVGIGFLNIFGWLILQAGFSAAASGHQTRAKTAV